MASAMGARTPRRARGGGIGGRDVDGRSPSGPPVSEVTRPWRLHRLLRDPVVTVPASSLLLLVQIPCPTGHLDRDPGEPDH